MLSGCDTGLGPGDASDVAVPSGLGLVRTGIGTVEVSWTDNSNGETGYEVERDGVVIAALPPDANLFSDSGIPISATPRSYRVRAVGTENDSE